MIDSFLDVTCDDVSDEPSVAFKEGHFVGEYTFQKNTHAEVTCDIRRSDEHRVLCEPEVSQMDGFRQNEDMSRCWGLYFPEFSLEVLQEDLLETSA